MTVNTVSSMAEIKLDMMELKLDRLIDEMRFLKSRMCAEYERQLGGGSPPSSPMAAKGRYR